MTGARKLKRAKYGCAKIETRKIRFFQGVHIFCLGTLLYNDTVVVTMFNQDFKPLCKTTQIVAILFTVLNLFHRIFFAQNYISYQLREN